MTLWHTFGAGFLDLYPILLLTMMKSEYTLQFSLRLPLCQFLYRCSKEIPTQDSPATTQQVEVSRRREGEMSTVLLRCDAEFYE